MPKAKRKTNATDDLTDEPQRPTLIVEPGGPTAPPAPEEAAPDSAPEPEVPTAED